MDSETSSAVCVASVMAAGCIAICAMVSCQKDETRVKNEAAAKERAQMIEGGYSFELVPGQRDPIWVRKNASK